MREHSGMVEGFDCCGLMKALTIPLLIYEDSARNYNTREIQGTYQGVARRPPRGILRFRQ